MEDRHGHGLLLLHLQGHLFRVLFVGSLWQIVGVAVDVGVNGEMGSEMGSEREVLVCCASVS